MEDKSLHSSQPTTISEGLQHFIDSMVEEIVWEGKPFDTQKRYLKKFSENEGLDYDKLEADITTFIEILDSFKSAFSKLQVRLAKEKGKECYVSDEMVEKLVNHSTPSNIIRNDDPKPEMHETIISIDMMSLGISVLFFLFFFFAYIWAQPIANMAKVIPAICFVGIAITGWVKKKNIQLIMWCGTALWMAFYSLWFAAYYAINHYDIIFSNKSASLTTLLTIAAFVIILVLAIHSKIRKYNPEKISLLIAGISATMFVICHFVVISQLISCLWYGIFVIAIFGVTARFWKRDSKDSAMFAITTIIIGSLLAEWCQGIHDYYYYGLEYHFFLYSYYQLIGNGIIIALCVILILYALLKPDLSAIAKAFCFYMVLLLGMVDLALTNNTYLTYGSGYSDIGFWYLGCAYPATYAFLSIHNCCYLMNLLRPDSSN